MQGLSRIIVPLGNVTQQTDLTYPFHVRPREHGLSANKLPFQVGDGILAYRLVPLIKNSEVDAVRTVSML